ncbi:aspartate kinase [Micromonospora sp. NPDC005215]|uniref:aspartate kinase n=1 Tax=Micromonospora sp. NPDC005215 TaxID=3157024 RepID=UPI0033A81500
MPTTVHKYGGSSLADMAALERVAANVARGHRSGERTVVVVSARGNTTDDLLRLAGRIHAGAPARELDQLLATGENQSAALLAMVLHRLGVPAVSFTGPQAGIRAEGVHGAGLVADVDPAPLHRRLAAGEVAVVAGFQGLGADGDVRTLGRGGSDTTAVALAAALAAERCDIYTDVSGVLTADPRVVPQARVLARVDPAVMAEMAFAGARVLHSRAVELAAVRAVRVRVLSSLRPGGGTVIPERSDPHMLETSSTVTAIAHDADVARVLVETPSSHPDPATEVLAVLAEHAVPVDLVARSGPQEEEFRIGFTVRSSELGRLTGPLRDTVAALGGQVRVDDNVGKVSVIGMGLLNRPEYTARMLAALRGAGIPTSWISISQLRTSAVIPRDRLTEAVGLLHAAFGLAELVPA